MYIRACRGEWVFVSCSGKPRVKSSAEARYEFKPIYDKRERDSGAYRVDEDEVIPVGVGWLVDCVQHPDEDVDVSQRFVGMPRRQATVHRRRGKPAAASVFGKTPWALPADSRLSSLVELSGMAHVCTEEKRFRCFNHFNVPS